MLKFSCTAEISTDVAGVTFILTFYIRQCCWKPIPFLWFMNWDIVN